MNSAAAAKSGWCRAFPATADQVGKTRRFLAAILGDNPSAEAAVICVSELASNAIIHSRSAAPGGTFTVRMRRSGSAIRVEVQDQGGPWRERPADPEHGRGLKVVCALTDRRGITVEGPRHDPHQRVVWFEIKPR